MVTPITAQPPHATLTRRCRLRRLRTSMLAAGAQVGIAIVVALGSIGLASVAALLAPAGPSAEQVVAAAAARAVAPGHALTPREAARADGQDDASPRATPHR
jgi:hypothetical protein